ncbi:twin-arginine translocation signal domain-containing protein, partial [Streptomyces albidoflavus]
MWTNRLRVTGRKPGRGVAEGASAPESTRVVSANEEWMMAVNRRGFVGGSAAVGAGLALGAG